MEFDEIIENILKYGDHDVGGAIELLIRYGSIDGEHHKTWVIDQAVRKLAGPYYDELIAAANDGENGPNTYEWNIGIAP